MIEIIDCEQGEPEWFAARLGLPTASRFADILAEGGDDRGLPQSVIDAMIKNGCTAPQLAAAIKAAKSRSAGGVRRRYLRDLAGEILTGEITDGYSNAHMERGHEMEERARDLYAFARRADVRQVGFIRNGRAGASPDSLIGDAGGLEIKTAIPAVQIERLQRGTLPPEHRAQVQGSLWVAEREWWDFVSYWPKLPPLIVRVHRDEAYIAELAKAVDAFNEELDALVGSIRTYENFRQVAA